MTALGKRPNKRLGQVFLVKRSVVQRVVETAAEGLENSAAFELGSGLGNITEALAEKFDWLFSVELDAKFVENTQLRLSEHRNITFVCADAISKGRIRTDLLENFSEGMKERRIEEAVFVSNMPYCISGAVLMSLPTLPRFFKRAVIMMQDEVYRRVVAEEGSRDYGILGVVLRRFFKVHKVAMVPPDSFYPMPKVESAVLLFLPKEGVPDTAEYEASIDVLARLFSTRRKTLRQTLLHRFGLENGTIERIIEKDEAAMRVEQLPLDRIWRLVEEVKKICEL